jgi:sugar transferase (PEP-CTERM/EpsH1 system associated)
MKILYLSQRFPYPPDRGDRIPVFNHIKHLSKLHKVHVASLIGSRDELRHVEGMKEWATSVTVEYQPRWKSALGKVAAWFTGRTLSQGHYWNRKLHARLADLIKKEGIEAVVVFSSSMAQYVEPYPQLIRIMNFCDLDSQKWAQLSLTTLWPKSWIYRREASLLLEYERKIAASFDSSCVVTENEAKLFNDLIPGVPVPVLANGVDHAFFGAVEWKPVDLQLTFVGVMDYEPNAEAVEFFVKEAWPEISRRHPGARFTIVGSKPTSRVQALAKTPGVTVTGFVPDVRPYLSASTLVVVPLKVARGIQNKILEAMAAGVPVATTPAAAGGLPASAHEALFIVDRADAGDFSKRLSELLTQREAMQDRARKARTFVQTNYSWTRTGEVLENLLFEAKASRDSKTPAAVPGARVPAGKS